MKILIGDEGDWTGLRELGIDAVVDPMVMRCGEQFLKGSQGVADPARSWSLIDANLDALGMFFDSLILCRKLPVFNYADTFDMKLNFEERTFARANDLAQSAVLIDIHVAPDAYGASKSAALTELKDLLASPPKIPQDMAKEICDELSEAEYQWCPELGELEGQLDHENKKLAQFLLGGLIFAAYAKKLGGDHMMQPKRARLFVAASLQQSPDFKFEDVLFAELKERANSPCMDLPWRPTFFPYLLSLADTPAAVLDEAMKLRASGMAADYRDWFTDAVQEWRRNGVIRWESTNALARIADAFDQLTKPSPVKMEIKALLAVIPAVTVDPRPAVKKLWGWYLAHVPGHDYRKLLMRVLLADANYKELKNRVSTVWRSSGAGGGHSSLIAPRLYG